MHSAEEAAAVIQVGLDERTITATYRHEQSNRSHCIVRVTQESRDNADTELRHVLRSSLLLVDLAGSETVSDNTTSRAASEGKAIVKSLFWLRRCIHALSSGQRPDFRSSKLTRLLEPSLIHGCVSIICNTSSVVTNMRQVVDALEFGQQAQVVRLNPTQNVAEGGACRCVADWVAGWVPAVCWWIGSRVLRLRQCSALTSAWLVVDATCGTVRRRTRHGVPQAQGPAGPSRGPQEGNGDRA